MSSGVGHTALCFKCHKGADGVAAQAEIREYREWKQRTGKTLAEIA